MIRIETFYEEHPTDLTDEEKRLRTSTASRAWPRMAQHEREEVDLKAEQKRAMDALKAAKEKTIKLAQEASRAAHEGHEPRQVLCREELVGTAVITIRIDTGATVGERQATNDELNPREAKAPATVTKLHAVKAEPAADDIASRLRGELLIICQKPRAETLALKALEGGAATKDATKAQRKLAVASALKDGALVRNDVGMLCLPAAIEEAPPADDSIPFGGDAEADTDEHAGDPDEARVAGY